MNDKKIDNHTTFGLIQFSRVSGAGRLFGSPLPNHFGTIRVRIHKAERVHESGQDYYNADQQYIEVELSASQFAEAITTMNVERGVPCTVRRLDGKDMGQVPDTEANETVRAEESFKTRVAGFVNDVRHKGKALDAILGKDRIGKDDRAAIREIITHVVREVESNAPFFLTLFTESAGKVVVKAKSEIAAMLDHAMRIAGVEHLASLNGRSATPELSAHVDTNGAEG
jgi:hypothetical protein